MIKSVIKHLLEGMLKDDGVLSDPKGKQKTTKDEHVVEACDPNDRLRATEGCFLMTDMADVESIAEPANNGKV